MATLIDRLARLIAQDNAVLFVGTDLRQENADLPSIQRIAEALATRIEYQRTDRSLAAVARDFEILRGRNELIMALRDELAGTDLKPTPLYQLIADAVLPMTKVITTRFDQAIERALDQFDKPYVRIIRDTDVPFFDETKVTLIKMQGDISQPDSLVITEDDIDAFISRLPTVSDVVRAFFATKTLIFIGYDLSGVQFKRFYRQVTRNLSNYRREAFAIVDQSVDDVEENYWRSQNVAIHTQALLPFLETLSQAVKAQVKDTPPAVSPLTTITTHAIPKRPYKALDSFTAADSAIFAGRAEESQRLTNRILAHRLTVLYGESGSGKSSILQAGAMPLLAKQRALLAVSQPLPNQPLLEQVTASLIQTGQPLAMPTPADDGLLNLIREWQHALDGPVVIGIDQFEQFFLVYQNQEQQATLGILRELVNDRSLDLRLVLVMREDFLGRLQTLANQIPTILDTRFRLERLGREAARAAIEEPARLFSITWDPALVQTLLDELYDDSQGGVAPPQLQIVCDYLYQSLIAERRGAAPAGAEITLTQYQALGGAETILGNYLTQVLDQFPEAQQLPVQLLLGSLVSSSGVKQRLPLSELSVLADLQPPEAASLLDALTAQRLLRRFERISSDSDESQLEYELTHDYLVNTITAWLGDEFVAAQKMREIVRQGLPDWEARGRLLALDDLRLLSLQREQVRFLPAELALIYATAIGYGYEPQLWVADLPRTEQQAILLDLLTNPEPFIRRRAALQLAAFGGDEVAAALAQAALTDTEPNVRQGAISAMLGTEASDAQTASNPPTINQQAIANVVTALSDPNQMDAAQRALVTLRDRQPKVQEYLPTSLEKKLQRQVWWVRWQRYQQHILTTTLRGMQGGGWGLGLGLGLFLGLNSAVDSAETLALITQNIKTVIQLMSIGIPLAGLMGALTGGGSAFTGVTLRHLQDRDRPWGNWIITTIVGAVIMALAFLLLGLLSPGTVNGPRSLAAGFFLGTGLVGSAALPLQQSKTIRLGLSIGISTLSFILIDTLQLIYNVQFWWLIVMGIVGGVGFFMGLRKDGPKPLPLNTPILPAQADHSIV